MEQKNAQTNPELYRRRTAFVGRRANLRGYFPQVEEKSVLSALSSCRRSSWAKKVSTCSARLSLWDLSGFSRTARMKTSNVKFILQKI